MWLARKPLKYTTLLRGTAKITNIKLPTYYNNLKLTVSPTKTSLGKGTYSIHKTNRWVRQSTNTLLTLKSKHTHANLVSCDSLIQDQIVCSITCDKTRGRLLREGDITLQKALDICRASEAMTLQLNTISDAAATNVATESEIHSIGTKSKKNITTSLCDRCGYKHTQECRKCGHKNHFAKACRTDLSRKS